VVQRFVVEDVETNRLEAALAIVRQASARLSALTEQYAAEEIGLRAVAERLYAERRRRDGHFPPGLFGEPAWDLLLALFMAHEDGRDLSLAESFEAARVPAGEGPPLVRRLERAGLVQRRSRNDDRRAGLALTQAGADRLADYLAEVV
jgi:MarR family transcriptional regulator, temperature-dependent positive regulator of motility